MLLHARPAQPWLRGVGATSAARSVEDSVCGAHGDASGDASAHREGRGQARGEAIAMGLCGPAPKHPMTERRSKAGFPIPRFTRFGSALRPGVLWSGAA